ncbi:hypothetical protein JTB14_007956 [Gonioctena quinquepunctata]|nr:hypothetical protein JTB14_007956 [Gonioctena quinquepunctata]
MYLPDYNWRIHEVETILQQLPETYIIMGDLNEHPTLGGFPIGDFRRRRIESTLDNEIITISLNSGEVTHFNARSSRFTSIDLTMCSSSTDPTLNSEDTSRSALYYLNKTSLERSS